MELYNYFRSSASFRVRIALALKGLDYDYRPVSLVKNEQFNESYASVSAARLVPLVSSAACGALNYYFIRGWGRRAQRHFRERHLLVRQHFHLDSPATDIQLSS